MKYSIIIVAYGAWEYLDACLASIRNSDTLDHEVIVVDNTPGPRTPEQKAILWRASRIIRPETNLGFAQGCNLGAKEAQGQYLIFLNPDTEVTRGWANRLAGHLEAHPEAGAIGPISNFVAGAQNASLNLNPSTELMQTKLLIGFCLMMRKEVYEQMGGMDPGCFLGCDDLDLSWRLRLAGYSLLIAPDVFVYHAGHKSMDSGPKPEVAQYLTESEAHLRQKILTHYNGNPPTAIELWGIDFFQTKNPGRMTLSVCMIVRDEEMNLTELLPQLEFADEIIIVDTDPNKPDGKAPFFYSFADYKNKPPIFHGSFPWADDFAAARNFARSKATGDWILWLDADDRIPEKTAKLIRQGMDNPTPRMLRKNCYFDLQVECMVDGKPGESIFQPRILPNLEGWKWEGAVHETVLRGLKAMDLKRVVGMDMKIIHTGYDTYDLRLAKAERNIRILRTMPDTPQKYFDMGNAYASVGQFHEGYGFFRLLLDRWEIKLEKGFRDHITYMCGSCLFQLGDHRRALEYLTQTDKPDATYLRALCLEAMGEPFQRVLQAYLNIPEGADTWGTNRAHMTQEARKKLAV